ncbi:hypothetical protein [Hymenobacter cavernae]|uniref:hypothetical protein n=1 Tax=Hymenobacter cavernae TaxID=2044852 RepID=UPI00166C81FA|nr:hypothetical protein [Hymenobacter cavernae]
MAKSVKLDEPAGMRSILEIRSALAKAFELAQHPLFDDSPVFAVIDDSPMAMHRTTVARMLLEIDTLPRLKNRVYTMSSQGLEMAIDHLDSVERILSQVIGSGQEQAAKLYLGSQLNGQLNYLVDIARHGVITTNQTAIEEYLDTIPSNAKKVTYLKQLLLSYKQREEHYDKKQFAAICKFIKLEKKKWALSVENSTPYFTTPAELLRFISDLITTELEHAIRQQGGYKNFWRDERCTDDKKETEVQQYIRSILDPACRQKSIKIHREVFAADGSIDMTFTYLDLNVCMEIKKAQHAEVDKAMSKQLVAYMQAEKTTAGLYLVLWYKSQGGISLPARYASAELLADHLKNYPVEGYLIEPHVIDCTKPVSPSKQR